MLYGTSLTYWSKWEDDVQDFQDTYLITNGPVMLSSQVFLQQTQQDLQMNPKLEICC